MMRADRRRILTYYSAIFLLLYGGNLLIRSLHPGLPFSWLHQALISVALIAAMASLAKYLGDMKLGLGVKGIWESLVYFGAIYSVTSLTLMGLGLIMGINPLSILFKNALAYRGNPWFQTVPKPFLPIAALITWTLAGLFWVPFTIAYPYEMLGRKYLPIVMLGVILTYNSPLITWEWKLDDLLFLGVLFPLIYSRTRNSAGLIINYVALYEFPVAVAFLRGWGEPAFWSLIAFRIGWSTFCLIMLLYSWVNDR